MLRVLQAHASACDPSMNAQGTPSSTNSGVSQGYNPLSGTLPPAYPSASTSDPHTDQIAKNVHARLGRPGAACVSSAATEGLALMACSCLPLLGWGQEGTAVAGVFVSLFMLCV